MLRLPLDEELLAAIKAAMPGLSQSTVDAMTDDQLKELVANLPAPAPVPVPAPTRRSTIGAAAAASISRTRTGMFSKC